MFQAKIKRYGNKCAFVPYANNLTFPFGYWLINPWLDFVFSVTK